MIRSCSIIILTISMVMLNPSMVHAGDITLHDGSTISGKLLTVDQQALTIRVDENQRVMIQIPLEQIRSISNLTELEVSLVGQRLQALIVNKAPDATQKNTSSTSTVNRPATNTNTNTKTKPDGRPSINVKYTAEELRNVPENPKYKILKKQRDELRQTLITQPDASADVINAKRAELSDTLNQLKQMESGAIADMVVGLRAFYEAQYTTAFKHFHSAAQFPQIHTLVKNQTEMEMSFLLTGTYALATSSIKDSDGTGWVDENKRDFKIGRMADPTTNGRGVTTSGATVGNGTGVILSDQSNGHGVFLAHQLSQTLEEVFGDKQYQLDKLYQNLLRLQSGAINIYQQESLQKLERLPYTQN